jgi:hypothetical protein
VEIFTHMQTMKSTLQFLLFIALTLSVFAGAEAVCQWGDRTHLVERVLGAIDRAMP